MSPPFAGVNVRPGSNPGVPTRTNVTALTAAMGLLPATGSGRNEKNSGEAACINTAPKLPGSAPAAPQFDVTCTVTGPGATPGGACTLS